MNTETSINSANLMASKIVSETSNIVSKIKENTIIKKIEVVKVEIINVNILWTQLLLYDGDVLPIKIDILKNITKPLIKNIYLSPGSGLNTETNFITPKNKNLAIFLAKKGYLVVGVTPREDAATLSFNFELMKDWGLTKHTNDFSEIIDIFQNISNIDYDVLGHSAGAGVVLNYSSITTNNNKLKVARIIDMIGQYPPNSQEFQNAQASLNATNQVINGGLFINTDNVGIKFLVQQAITNPTGDSGFPRPTTGNFTNEGLVFFSLIFTGQLPGILTPITGLPSNWYLKQGYLAGTYEFGPTPQEDIYSLTHTDIQTIYNSIGSLGSGIYPLIYDSYATWIGSFPLQFANIKVPVFYINTDLGFGDASHTVSLLTNATVTYAIVNTYGHADPVYSKTARTDFWGKLVP